MPNFKPNHILIVDDETDLCEILRFNLEAAGIKVSVAHSAIESMGTDLARFDLFLLDVLMPGMSGFQLAETLKNYPDTKATPIIFLTAKDTEADTLHGFDLGADDYVTKPFSVREVVARVSAVLRRHNPQPHKILSYEGLRVNLDLKQVTVDGNEVQLTKTEFELLYTLLSRRSQVLSREQLIREAWPPNVIVTERAVDVNITRLRKKIGPYAALITTKQGFGYCFIG